ncbi:hypothetical protein [Pseudomonas chlororaphis]|uniref:hypothetical protein n=1 Tax=Pseudomonas chlororaphis TaxID=587753 RepID=UPI000A61142C|nr:hypothetical protein [Pseudomonas chlororaphis]
MTDNKELKRLAAAIESCTSIPEEDEAAWMRRTTGRAVGELLEELENFKVEVPKWTEREIKLIAENDLLKANFKNFHRSLCERFGYYHDDIDWQRDQASLEEHIAAQFGHVSAENSSLRGQMEAVQRGAGQLADENACAKMRIKELDLLFGRYLLGMRAAVIDEECGGHGMKWIYNGLRGPGELPPEGETDAQAYFDREIVAVEKGMEEVLAFHDARLAIQGKVVKP